MTDFLQGIAARVLADAPLLRPRPASRFEPSPLSAPIPFLFGPLDEAEIESSAAGPATHAARARGGRLEESAATPRQGSQGPAPKDGLDPRAPAPAAAVSRSAAHLSGPAAESTPRKIPARSRPSQTNSWLLTPSQPTGAAEIAPPERKPNRPRRRLGENIPETPASGDSAAFVSGPPRGTVPTPDRTRPTEKEGRAARHRRPQESPAPGPPVRTRSARLIPAASVSITRIVETERRIQPQVKRSDSAAEPSASPRSGIGPADSAAATRPAGRSGRGKDASERLRPLLAADPSPKTGPAPASPAPTIHVSIGRVEVKAVTAPSSKEPKRAAAPPVMSLDEFLAKRADGGGK